MEPINVNDSSPRPMNLDDRWNLYSHWLNLYANYLVERLVGLQREYDEVYKYFSDERNKLVIGMTTTEAARLQTTLEALRCRVVTVKEAAEVLESHVTVSLTKHREHLLLIGDHQQFRPSTADYRMETKFNLGVQHRMRPEIAQLIVPHIYPELKNHYSVARFPPIKGIDKAVFFIHHEYEEKRVGDDISNLYEAKFLIKLACYLRKVGYEPQDITILSACPGQMFALCYEKQKYQGLLKDVRICVLDDYQGEGCKIILLSLVRNNRDEQIGFLQSENRICMALSRAKQGLYIMGNMDLLCRNSEIWPKIRKVLIKQSALGSHLTIRCEIHPYRVTFLKQLEDFANVPEGGCLEICGKLLKCKHNCTQVCHIQNRDHSINTCTAPCSKVICINGHMCGKLCKEECENSMIDVACNADINFAKCLRPCLKLLPCGHKCPKLCQDACGSCGVQVLKQLSSCNHKVKVKCSETPNIKDCKGACTKQLACGHFCKNMCNEICTTECQELVDVNLGQASPCGHQFKVMCYVRSKNLSGDLRLSMFCPKPCNQILECLHKCSGNCGMCFQGRIHLACFQRCQIFLKDHQNRSIPCREVRAPSEHQYFFKCCHVKSRRGFTDCNAPCARRCKHMRCKARCSQECTVAPCQKPCDKMLQCGHPCIGFCGEPCPRLCRICHIKEYPDFFFGDRQEESTRFVLLDECKHVVESKDLENYFKLGDIENGVLVDCRRCPRCKIPLISTLRYSDHLKKTLKDVFYIKMKIYGRLFERKSKHDQLVKMVKSLENMNKTCFLSPPCFARCMKIYRSILEDKEESFNLVMGKHIETKFIIIERILKIFPTPTICRNLFRQAVALFWNQNTLSKEITMYWNNLLAFLTTQVQHFTNQTILDIEREMCRLQKMKHILDISINFKYIDISEIKELVFQPKPFTKDWDNQVTAKLEEVYKLLGKNVPDMSYRAFLQDINFKIGLWFRCPKGHYFMDCGDPTQISKCEECSP